MATDMKDPFQLKETQVSAKTAAGDAIRAIPQHLSQLELVFETHQAANVLRTSEVLQECRILFQDQCLYSGRAVIERMVDAGPRVVCVASLDQASWSHLDFTSLEGKPGLLAENFQQFYREVQKYYRLDPKYKLLAADIQILFNELRLWLDQVEVGIRSSPSADRLQLEREVGDRLEASIFPPIDELFGRLEQMTAAMEEDLAPAHRTYIKRQLHPHILCSPFAFRTVQKPLGYAGDYEMVNMILRHPHEGGTLFAKMLNRWFIKQPPAEAHRNRIRYLKEKILEETARGAAAGRQTRIFNLGCGPAQEIQDFLVESEATHRTLFTLLDFSEETLNYARQKVEAVQRAHHRRTSIQFVRKAVTQILKGKSRSAAGSPALQHDFIYCAGLFDYLTDAVCKQLMDIFYDQLAPGGLLVVTNVDVANPIRHWLADILEWHLIYRNSGDMERLRPSQARPEDTRIVADITGVNLFMEVRKPGT